MLSDYVADKRLPTPSLAGTYITEYINSYYNEVKTIMMTNKMIVNDALNNVRHRLIELTNKIKDPNILLKQREMEIEQIINTVKYNVKTKLDKCNNRLNKLKYDLEYYNKLKGGVNMLIDSNGNIIKSVSYFNDKTVIDNLVLKLEDGEINIEIRIK